MRLASKVEPDWIAYDGNDRYTIPKRQWKNWSVEHKFMGKYFKKYYRTRFFYCELNNLVGDRDWKWEHYATHEIEDPVEYYREMDPVIVKYDRSLRKYVFSDGFHRVNFCVYFGVPVPVVVLHPKKGVHEHAYYFGSKLCYYFVTDEECQEELSSGNLIHLGGRVECKKHGIMIRRGEKYKFS